MRDKIFENNRYMSAIPMGIMAFLIAQTLGELSFFYNLPKGVASIFYGIITLTMTYVFIGLIVVKYLKLQMPDIGFKSIKFEKKWIGIGLIFSLVILGIFISLSSDIVNNTENIKDFIDRLLITIFTFGVVGGLVEELLFRGLIMHIIEKIWNKKAAVFIISLVFGFLNMANGLSGIEKVLGFLGGFSLASMLGIIFYNTESLMTTGLFHMILNIFLFGNLFNINAQVNPDIIFYGKLKMENILISGGSYGIKFSIITIIGYILVSIYGIKGTNDRNDKEELLDE